MAIVESHIKGVAMTGEITSDCVTADIYEYILQLIKCIRFMFTKFIHFMVHEKSHFMIGFMLLDTTIL